MICSISGIRLPSSCLICIGPHNYISKTLLQKWVTFAGPVDFEHRGLDASVLTALGPLEHGCSGSKKTFFTKEFDEILYAIFRMDQFEETSAIMYFKVLLGACIRYDATLLVLKLIQIESTMNYIQLDNPNLEELYLEIREIIFTVFTSFVTDITAEAAISSLNMVGRMPSNVAVLTTVALVS